MSDLKFRKVFDTDFKLQVVQVVSTQGLSISHAWKDMKPGEGTVRPWLEQLVAAQSGQSGIGKPVTAAHRCTGAPAHQVAGLWGQVTQRRCKNIYKSISLGCPGIAMRSKLIFTFGAVGLSRCEAPL